MAEFAIRHLSVLSYAQGFTLWHYMARHLTLAQVLAPGFFNPCADMLADLDMILVSASDRGGQAYIRIANGHVTAALMSSSQPMIPAG